MIRIDHPLNERLENLVREDLAAMESVQSKTPKGAPALSEGLRRYVDPIGTLMTDSFHLLMLFAIGAATIWAAIYAFMDIISKTHASIEDLLLLFIYLEIGSMVGIYFKTNRMPLRFIVYIAITAVTRHLIGYVNHEVTPGIGILILAGAILILAFAVLIIRYASAKYGSGSDTSSANALNSDGEKKVKIT